jgi:dephospho-CoA kinase
MLPASTPFAVADIPLLYETRHESDFEVVVVAACEPEEQIRRVMTRDGLTEAEARSRVAAQLPIGEKISRADYVVWTTGTQAETSGKVEDVIGRLTIAG